MQMRTVVRVVVVLVAASAVRCAKDAPGNGMQGEDSGGASVMTAPASGGAPAAPMSMTASGGMTGGAVSGSGGMHAEAGGSGGMQLDASSAKDSGGATQPPPDAGSTSGTSGSLAASMNDGKPYPDISFAGLVSALELAPLRLAAGGIYPGKIAINSGGVDNLFGAAPVLVATNAETQALRVSVQHSNLRIIFTLCEGLYRIVAKKSAGISTLADLRGKTIAVPGGTSSQYYLSRMLGAAGLTESDVTVSNQFPGMGPLAADAATVWEPGIQYVENNLGSDAIDLQNDDSGHEVYRELFNLHATAESLSDPDKRRAIVELVRALIDASVQLRADPTAADSVLSGPSGEGQADLDHSMHYERYQGTLVDDVLDVLEQEEPWRAQLDGRNARTRADLEPLVDRSVVMEALGM